MSIDQAAYALGGRVKPNRRLIASVGFVLGLMMGVFGALFLNFVNTARGGRPRRSEAAAT